VNRQLEALPQNPSKNRAAFRSSLEPGLQKLEMVQGEGAGGLRSALDQLEPEAPQRMLDKPGRWCGCRSWRLAAGEARSNWPNRLAAATWQKQRRREFTLRISPGFQGARMCERCGTTKPNISAHVLNAPRCMVASAGPLPHHPLDASPPSRLNKSAGKSEAFSVVLGPAKADWLLARPLHFPLHSPCTRSDLSVTSAGNHRKKAAGWLLRLS